MNGKIVSLLVSLTVIVGSVLTVKGYEMYMFEYSIDGDVLNVTVHTESNKIFEEKITYEGSEYVLIKDSVKYETITEESTQSEETIERVEAENLLSKNDYKLENAPEEYKVQIGEKDYIAERDSIKYEEVVNTGRRVSANENVTYRGVDQEPEVADTCQTSVFDDVTGQVVQASISLVGVNKTDDYWKYITEPFVFTASNYDADELLMVVNGKEIVINKNGSPISSEYFNDMLIERGMSPDKYRLSSLEWDGEAYEENGVMYRKATGVCQHKVADYNAAYSGPVDLPAYTQYNAVITYKYKPESKEVIKNIAKYELIVPTEELTEKPTEAPTEESNDISKATVVGIAVVILAVSVVLILYFAQRNKVKN